MTALNQSALPQALHSVCRHINTLGGRAWLVGGCVRDLLHGLSPKDFDLEVYDLKPEALESALATLGRTGKVGAHFGVIKLWLDGLEVDVALPRTETKTGAGHQGFAVVSDPHLPTEKAVSRRDFTINAMMYDPLTNELQDLHNGRADLENKILRHVGPAFIEDPLRPLRAVQFAARFQMQLGHETAELCRTMLKEADSLPTSRIWGEWQKWSHAPFPSYGLKALQDSGWISLYPELQSMVDCPQDPRWHPEGCVWEHTLQVCDQAARIATDNDLNSRSREQLLFAALCHDLGKPSCTFADEDEHLHSPGHCGAGVELSEHLLRQIGAPGYVKQFVPPLVREHLVHMHGQPTDRAVRRLSCRLEPANIELWEMLVHADASGRAPTPPSRPALAWLEKARELRHNRSKPEPIITGKMLIQLGLKPGPVMGRLLKEAYAAQLDGEICDEPSALEWFKENGQKHTSQQHQ